MPSSDSHSRSILVVAIIALVLATLSFAGTVTLLFLQKAIGTAPAAQRESEATAARPAVAELIRATPVPTKSAVRSATPAAVASPATKPSSPATPKKTPAPATTPAESTSATPPVYDPNAVPPDETSATAGDTSGSAPAAPVSVNGGDFAGEQFQPPEVDANGMQLLKHYGTVTANIELPHGATREIITLKPRPINGSLPQIRLYLERTSGGPYAQVMLIDNETISNGNPITKDVTIEPGSYRINLLNTASTKPDRPHLEIHSVEFR